MILQVKPIIETKPTLQSIIRTYTADAVQNPHGHTGERMAAQTKTLVLEKTIELLRGPDGTDVPRTLWPGTEGYFMQCNVIQSFNWQLYVT